MDRLRNWLRGKKSYLAAAIGAAGALLAWADGQIDLMGLLAALWAAASTCFIRAGIAKAAANGAGQPPAERDS
jgi:hypothetical protein